jgi:adenylyl cyclase-associated protein
MSLEKAVTDLVTRLETVTKRLETVEKQLASGIPAASSHAAAPSAASSAGSEEDSAAVQEYDGLISQFIQPYLEHSKKIGDVVQTQADLVLKAIEEQRKLISVASKAKKPDDSTLQSLIKPCSDLMGKIVEIREKNRAHKLFNNLSAISEGISALGWVVVSPAPAPFVNEARGSSEFYSNRILKDFKGKDQLQCDWVTSWNGFLKELAPYIKKHHTTGLTWNPRGGDAKQLASASHASGGAHPPAPAGPSGPAPPPPPPSSSLVGDAPAADKKANTGALFAELNKGDAITSGLKKVTADMKTKNRDPNERSAVVPAVQPKATSKAPAAQAGQKVGTPKVALIGNKWTVEWQHNNKEIIIADTEPRHTVYIYKCEGSVIQIKGKVNAITIDSCKKTGVAFDQAIATCEVVNSNSIDVQCTLSVPSYAIDKCSGVQLYLSEHGLGAEIVSSKIDAFNVVLPPLNPTDDPLELAVPEQYKTTVKGRTLHTEIVQHSG